MSLHDPGDGMIPPLLGELVAALYTAILFNIFIVISPSGNNENNKSQKKTK